MTQTGIADLGRRFGDVEAPAAQQLSRAFHAQIAQILRNGQANFTRKNPAKINWTATKLLSEHLERGRIGADAREQLFRSLVAFPRDALLPHAKEPRIFWGEKKM